MKKVVTASKLGEGGLRYEKKVAGSPYGSSQGFTYSCIKCGRHRTREMLTSIRLAGTNQYRCTEPCTPPKTPTGATK